jgi:ribosomal protein S18 acetylase RimI-like enzyme
MINHLCSVLANRGSPGAHLGVGEVNTRALHFYARLGFRELAHVGDVIYLGLNLSPDFRELNGRP